MDTAEAIACDLIDEIGVEDALAWLEDMEPSDARDALIVAVERAGMH